MHFGTTSARIAFRFLSIPKLPSSLRNLSPIQEQKPSPRTPSPRKVERHVDWSAMLLRSKAKVS